MLARLDLVASVVCWNPNAALIVISSGIVSVCEQIPVCPSATTSRIPAYGLRINWDACCCMDIAAPRA